MQCNKVMLLSLVFSELLLHANLLVESYRHAPAAAYVVTILHPCKKKQKSNENSRHAGRINETNALDMTGRGYANIIFTL